MSKRKLTEDQVQTRGLMLLRQIDQHFKGIMWIYTDRPIINEEALNWLEKQGYVFTRNTTEDGRARRYYHITEDGKRKS